MNYSFIYEIGNIFFFSLLGVCLILLINKIIYHIFGFIPSKKIPEAKTDHKYAILIPARNESKVIEQLLKSIKNQNYNKDLIDTYIIVEDANDPTCEIAEKYENTQIFVRQKLELKGKGYALDEVLGKILSEEHDYEAYFIIDADNVLSPNFIKEMNKSYDAGYEMALGYRNSKNWNGGWIASCSALTFSMINTFQNKCRSKFNLNVIVSGTGFYVSSKIINKLNGWKFFTITEDYEFSMYSALNNVKSTYNEYAEFYDEQPTKFKVSWNQRLRWVKGFTQTNKKYTKKLFKSSIFDKENKFSKFEFSVSIIPIVSLILTIVAYTIFNIVLMALALRAGDPMWWKSLTSFTSAIIGSYLFLCIYCLLQFVAERKHIKINLKNTLSCVFMAPIFMSLYVPIFFNAIFKKDVKWIPIKHEININPESGNLLEVSIEETNKDLDSFQQNAIKIKDLELNKN